MQRDLEIPAGLQEDADVIHDRMLANAPKDITLVEGDFFWDSTRPAAEEKAETVQMKLQNLLMLAFPQTSYGQYLEFLGETKTVFKKPPTKSSGPIVINGVEGTVIRKGHPIGTIATDNRPSIEFVIDDNITIGQLGKVYTTATCTVPGTIGNVTKDTIKILMKSISGVESITNPEDFKNGTEIEDEEDFRERVLEAYRNEPLSGAPRDYKRWAKEVAGVGNVYVKPEWDGPGTVKVLVLDSNGKPANEILLKAVRLHIIGKEVDGKNTTDDGLSPMGAFITVSTPDVVTINISANFIIEDSFTLENVIGKIKKYVSEYLQEIEVGGTITYKAIDALIGSMIIRREGIKDYSNLTVNGTTNNIDLMDEVAAIGEVISI